MDANIADYLSLITSAHNQKPKYMAMLGLLGQPLVDGQNLAGNAYANYDLDQAIGSQLDVLGKWIGLSRQIPVPITGVFFAFNTDGLGWNQGLWDGPYTPSTGLTSLDDETYRIFLKAKIGVNHWDGTIESWQTVMNYVFAGTGTQITSVDHQDMSMDVVISGVPPTAFMQSLIGQGLLNLKPAAVRINGYYLTSVVGSPVFAFNAPLTSSFGGWNQGAWATTL